MLQTPHRSSIQSAIGTSLAAVALSLLTSCVEPPPPPIAAADIGPGIGPFDSQGNYREDWADDPSKWRRPSGPAIRDAAPPANASPLPLQQPAYNKPSVSRYTVKRGDTLSGIASRHRSSVSAIRRANGISGSLIFPGQRLIVPRR